MPLLRIRVRAWRDIHGAAEYLEAESGVDLAERFIDSVLAELKSLSKMPQMGVLCKFREKKAHDMRRWPVTGFERWLIFYKPLKGGIDVARVLHGAQDINSILD